MKTFIVHIYREDGKADQGTVGIVEEAGSEKKSRFTGFDELCRIMSGNNTKKKSVTRRSPVK